MAPFTFSVLTFGCRVNQADSFDCERDLQSQGGTAAAPETAELVVVNTCSVTGAADQAARQIIRKLARVNPGARIVATGCYATRRPEDLAQLPCVVQVIPNQRKERLAHLVNPAKATRAGNPAEAAPREENPPDAGPRGVQQWVPRPGQRGRTAYPLRVQTGCDEACSYCTIPSTRGRSRSRFLAAILAEARALAGAGYKELIVTGVHLGAYGRDLTPPLSLVDLLGALSDLDGADDLTFRVSSLEPMDCTPAVIHLVASSGRIAPHFHLPLQHASDRVLRAMGRPYTLDAYRRLVDGVRAALPDAAIGSDVIVGFPGESSEDHDELEQYLRVSGLTHLHVFPYSDRPGTAASTLAGKVPAPEVRRRADRLRAVSRRLASAFLMRQAGRVRDALTIEDGTRVVTDNYLKLAIPAGRPRNDRVRVRIAPGGRLEGEVVP